MGLIHQLTLSELELKVVVVLAYHTNLSFDKNRKESDKLFENNGVKIVVDTKSYLYLVEPLLIILEDLMVMVLCLIIQMLQELVVAVNHFHYRNKLKV